MLMLLFILTSCSGFQDSSSPSLNADDIWDKMAEERKKPLPVNSQADDSEEILSDLPPSALTGPLSSKDIEEYRTTLLTADENYKSIRAVLDTPLQKTETEEDRQVQLRTKQLHMSRLINLKNNMEQAIKAIVDVDQPLADEGREVLADVAEYITRTRNRLEELTY